MVIFTRNIEEEFPLRRPWFLKICVHHGLCVLVGVQKGDEAGVVVSGVEAAIVAAVAVITIPIIFQMGRQS